MKRHLALLALVLWLTGCAGDTETDYASALMWNDTLYYLSVQEVDDVPESAVIGTVTAETETFSRENGQANCCPPGTPVAETEEGLALLLDGAWYLCRPKVTGSAGQAP